MTGFPELQQCGLQESGATGTFLHKKRGASLFFLFLQKKLVASLHRMIGSMLVVLLLRKSFCLVCNRSGGPRVCVCTGILPSCTCAWQLSPGTLTAAVGHAVQHLALLLAVRLSVCLCVPPTICETRGKRHFAWLCCSHGCARIDSVCQAMCVLSLSCSHE